MESIVNELDFYLILGVERAAPVTEVKRAYKRLARRYHPDINPGDREAEAFFRLVSEAYETLCDPARRHEYDAYGTRASNVHGEPVEFQGFDFSSVSSGAGASATFDDLFSEVFEHAAASHESRIGEDEQGSDLFGEVSLTFEQAVTGAEQRLTVTRLDTCNSCGGRGRRRSIEGRCARCDGVGSTRWRRGHMVFSKPCKLCDGSGRLRHQACVNCGENGVVAKNEDITIKVPAGVNDGARLRIESKGNAGRFGGEPGNLYITVQVGAHRFLRREGYDLHLTLPIAIHEAALGAKIDVSTFDGSVCLRIPPGTQSGRRFHVSSRGIPSPHSGERGDFVIEVNVVLPPIFDERSKELLLEFAKIHSDDVRKDLFKE